MNVYKVTRPAGMRSSSRFNDSVADTWGNKENEHRGHNSDLRPIIRKQFTEALGTYMRVRHVFADMLNNQMTKGSIETKKLPFLNKKNGHAVGNIDHMNFYFLLKDPSIAHHYYQANPSLFTIENPWEAFYRHKQNEVIGLDYVTSFGFISKGMGSRASTDFSSIRHFDHYNQNRCMFDIRNKYIPPVLGYMMTKDTMEQVLSRYYQHPFYQLNMCHVLTLLEVMARDSRIDTKLPDRNFVEIGDAMLLNMRNSKPPVITLNSEKKPVKLYTGYGIIKAYDQTYNIEQCLTDGESLGYPWTALNTKMQEVVDRQKPNLCFGSHLVSKIILTVNLKTWSFQKTRTYDFRKQDFTSNQYKYINKKATFREEFLHQVVEVRTHYVCNSPMSFQPHGKFVFVTSNQGYAYDDMGVGYKNLACLTQHFGDGLPLQVEIEGDVPTKYYDDNSWYPFINKALAAETFAYSTDKMVHQAITQLPKHKKMMDAVKITGMTKIHEDPAPRKESGQDENEYSLLYKAWESNGKTATRQRFARFVINSWARNFPPTHAKTDPYEGAQQYHHNSYVKSYFACIVIGNSRNSIYAYNRVQRVIFFRPCGQLPFNQTFAPDWDLIGNNFELNPALLRPQTPRNAQGIDLNQMVLQSPRYLDPSLTVHLDARLDDSDDELDIDEIMRSATHPSVFDNEVYM